MSWNPFRDSWSNWSNDPSRGGSDRHQAEQAGAADWRSSHSIDPLTGDVIGTPGLIPAQYGLEFQLLHEQGRDRARQARMRSAANYARGALGLLQSFRPGGGATLEAGQYNALAQIEMNRAQMLQPLDLLGDYRRHESALANQRANRARETSTIVQIAGIAASALVGGLGGGVAGAFLGAGAGLLGGGGQGGGGPQYAEGGMQGDPGSSMFNQPVGAGMPGGGGQAPGGQAAAGAPGTQQATLGQSPFQQPQQGAQKPELGMQPPGAQPKSGAPGQPAGGQPGTPGGGAGMAGGGGPVGADGNFQPLAYAASAAGSQADPLQGVVLSLSLANRIDEDPAWDQISFAIDQRLRMRVRGAA